MGLLNDVKAADKAEVKAKAEVEVKAADDTKKAKKAERKEAKKAALATLIDFASKSDDPKIKAAVETLKTQPREGGFGPSALTKIFGTETPAKGTKITAQEVFTKAGFGFPEMRKFMKKWADPERKVKVIVELDPKTQTYEVK